MFGLRQSFQPQLQSFEAKGDVATSPPPGARHLSLLGPLEHPKARKSRPLELLRTSRSCAPRTVQAVATSVTPQFLIHHAPPNAHSVRKSHRGSTDSDFQRNGNSNASGGDDDEYDDDSESVSIGTMLFALSRTEEVKRTCLWPERLR